jgi:aryl-phospho-beta-D-glucosidase BglC (GH1 family)/chitodextrinase
MSALAVAAVLAAIAALLVAFGPLARAAGSAGAGYWRTSGSQILDANGNPVRIAGINWYGFETTDEVAHGLYTADYKSIINDIKSLGYNLIRLPYSDQMVQQNPVPSSISFYGSTGPINQDLQGLHSLDVMDKIINYAGSIGLKVILDNHRSEAGNSAEDSGLWYTSAYPESTWISDWTTLATRYENNQTVVGMDLRNEPHTPSGQAYGTGATWGTGSTTTDWRLAAERAGNAILAVNPNVLIAVEGIDVYQPAGGTADSDWWGGNLEGAAAFPVQLSVPNRLVYSAHDYGPDLFQQTWFNASTTYASLAATWNKFWGYLSAGGTAPVWVGEFGTTNAAADVASSTPGSQGQWFSSLIQYLHANPTMGWTYWALNGEDSFGLLDNQYDLVPANAQKQALLATIQDPLSGGGTGGGDTTAPSTPTGLTAGTPTASTVPLSWTASTDNIGVTGYQIFRGSTLVATANATSYTDTGLTASTAYTYTVKAIDAAGNTSPASASVSATTASGGGGSGATTCNPTGTIAAGDYTIQANEWNSTAQQCITYTGNTSWSVSTANFNLPTNGAPATYPSIYKGCHWGACTPASTSALPIQVSKLASATSSWSTTQPASGAYDVAYDIWFNSTPTTSGQPDGTELMIWLNSRGGVQPFGSQSGTASVAGHSWNVWTGQQTSWKIISYVLNPGATSVTGLDVRAIINDAVSRGSLNASNYLIDAEAGFEIWQGGQGLATNSFSFAATAGTNGGGGDTTAPTAPGNLAAGTVTSTSVPLTWGAATDNVGVTGYQIFRGSTKVATVTATSYTDTGLSPSTAYTYTVKAVDAAGNVSNASNAVTVTTAASGGSAGCSASYTNTSDWGSGFTATVVVTNTGGAPTNGWTVTWTWGGNQTVTNMWNATSTQNGHAQSAASVGFNSAIAPGANTSFGFQASYSGSNPAPTLVCTTH